MREFENDFKKGDQVELLRNSGNKEWIRGTYIAFNDLSDCTNKHIAKSINDRLAMHFFACRHFLPKLEVDAPVWVKDGNGWYPRHFAGWDDYRNILVWEHGLTSHTALDENDVRAHKEYSLTDPNIK